ncbi:MAG: purine-nucleoside phosphorylase [Ruminococcaceae bacterium]|nr:purine-nucleoside phosphorylase [Oscillospiraceae bacterium]
MIEKIKEAAEHIKNIIVEVPETALVLGSGLGFLSDSLQNKKQILYSDIPYFPVSTAPMHKGTLEAGNLFGTPVILMCGRFHYYEGYSMQEITFYIRVLKWLGVENIILTNAVGAINECFKVGDMIIVSDHIKFFDDTPLRGSNLNEFGPRFNDMTDAYTKELRDLACEVAKNEGIDIKEGIYAFMPGPCYETPAEIRMLKTLGADVVGMSTVPEVICASHSGMNVLAVSCCTNMAAGIGEKIDELSYTEDSKSNFSKLIAGVLNLMRRKNA